MAAMRPRGGMNSKNELLGGGRGREMRLCKFMYKQTFRKGKCQPYTEHVVMQFMNLVN